MQKKNLKPLILSSLAAVAMAGVGTGATFALFTDKAETQINVTAGIVDVSSNIQIVSVQELNDVEVAKNADGQYVSSIGSTTAVNAEGNTISLSNWTPGDKATFKISNLNKSNVKIKTRLVESHSTTTTKDLYDALKITYSVKDKNNVDITHKFMDWNVVEPAQDLNAGETISEVTVTVEFPNIGTEITARETGENNAYQGMKTDIVFTQQAVQANANVKSLLEEMNAAIVAEGHTNATMQEALADLQAASISKATVFASGYAWSPVSDSFSYPEEVPAAEQYKYFKMFRSMPAAADYSVYAYQWEGATSIELTGIGFDAGDESGFTSVSYVGAQTARSNIIRTNSAATVVTIDAPNDNVSHYGTAGSVTINGIAQNSYHENGKVGFLEVSKGRIALEKDSEVGRIHINAKRDADDNKLNEFDEITIAKDSAITLPELSRDDVSISDDGTLVVALQNDVDPSADKDYIWLTKQGIYEQIKISESGNSLAESVWADDNSNSENTQKAAQDVANNIGRDSEGNINATIEVGTAEYKVSVDPDTRDLVALDDNQQQLTPTETVVKALEESVEETGLSSEEKESAKIDIIETEISEQVSEEGDYVVRIGTKGYATLSEAVAAAVDGDVIVFLKDAQVDEMIEVGSSVTLALGDHYVVNNTKNARAFSLKGKCLNFTVKAGKNGGMKMAEGNTESYGFVQIGKAGDSDANLKSEGTTVNLIGGTYAGETNGASALVRSWAGIVLNIEDCLLEGNGGSFNNYQTYAYNKSVINIADSVLRKTGNNDSAVIFAGNAYVAIRNSTLESASTFASEFSVCDVDIYDSKFVATEGTSWENSGVGISGGTTCNIYGGTFSAAGHALEVYSSGGTFNVYGGTFEGSANAVLLIKDDNTYAAYGPSVCNVYGGTFKGNLTQSNGTFKLYGGQFDHEPSSDFVASGYVASSNGEGYVVTRDVAHKKTLEGTKITQAIVNTMEAGDWLYVDVEGDVEIDPNLTLPEGTSLVGKTNENGVPLATLVVGKYQSSNNYYIFSKSNTTIENFNVRAFDNCIQESGSIFQQVSGSTGVIYRNLHLNLENSDGLKCMTGFSVKGEVTMENVSIRNTYNGIRIENGSGGLKMSDVAVGLTHKGNSLVTSADYAGNIVMTRCSFAQGVFLNNKYSGEDEIVVVAKECEFPYYFTSTLETKLINCKFGTYGVAAPEGSYFYVANPEGLTQEVDAEAYFFVTGEGWLNFPN